MKVEFRPATVADVVSFHRELPFVRARAWVGKIDGETEAIGGYGFLPNAAVFFFLYANEKVRDKAPLSLMRAGRAVLADAKARGIVEASAIADPEIPASARFLERLGFSRVTPEGVYHKRL